MYLKAVGWVTLALCQHNIFRYQFVKSSAASKVVRYATPSGWGDRRSADVTLISLFSPEGDEKRRLDDATEYSSGWFSPSFGGDR